MPEEQLVVKSRVYERFPDRQIGSDFFDELNERVGEVLDRAADRAEANQRKTIQGKDV